MARTMDIGKDSRLIFDLIWIQAADHSRGAIREAAGDANRVTLVKNRDGDTMVGLYSPSAEEAKTKGRLISFAALMAHHYAAERSALVFVSTSDDNAAMAAIENGLPVPDTDRFGPIEELVDVAREYIAENPGTKVFGTAGNLGSTEIEEFDLDAFLKSKETRKLFGPCSIKKLDSNRRTMAMAAALLLFGAYVGYDYYEQKRKAEEAARLATMQKTPEQQYAEGLRAAIKQQGMPISMVKQLLGLAGKQETTAAGWRVSKLQCSSMGCNATWKREAKTATFADLISVLGKDRLTLATDQTAVKTIPASLSAAESAYPDPIALPKEQDAWVTLLTPLQKTGGVLNFGISQATVLPVDGITIPNGVRKSEIKVTGPAWGGNYFASLPNWALVRDLSFTLSAGSDSRLTIDGTIIFFTR